MGRIVHGHPSSRPKRAMCNVTVLVLKSGSSGVLLRGVGVSFRALPSESRLRCLEDYKASQFS
jgi:hypothetical protein